MDCPDCSFPVHGKTHDFWGESCPNCGWISTAGQQFILEFEETLEDQTDE